MADVRLIRAEPDGLVTDEHVNQFIDALQKYGITVAVGSGLFIKSGVIGLARKLEGWIKITSHTSGADYVADRVVRQGGAWVATAYSGEVATEASGNTSLSSFPFFARAVWEEDRWIFSSDQC